MLPYQHNERAQMYARGLRGKESANLLATKKW